MSRSVGPLRLKIGQDLGGWQIFFIPLQNTKLFFTIPLEIRELVIKFRVNDLPKTKKNTPAFSLSAKEKEDIVRQCYEKVLEKIESRLER